MNKDDICSICLIEIYGTEQIIILPCNHFYHFKCLSEYVLTGDKNVYNCPICRHPYFKGYVHIVKYKTKIKTQKRDCTCILL